jgi:two-component system KDP operon response regulator KdpE
MSGSVKKVLIVDDNPALLKALKDEFKVKGYDVLTTRYGTEVTGLVESEKPDIVLLDLMMPVMNGFEVLNKLRVFSRIPVIAISANEELKEEALKGGADVFIPKPFDLDEVLEIMVELWNR